MRTSASYLIWSVATATVFASTGSAFGWEWVTAEGQSAISKQEAVRDALRNAVERSGRLQLDAQSTVKDFELTRDIILTRASGLVRKSEILQHEKRDGVFTVRVRADVSSELIDTTWADVKHLLKQLGQPTIMLLFDDMIQPIDSTRRPTIYPDSQVANQVAKVLTEASFRVIKRSRHDALKQKNASDLADDDRYELFKATDNASADLYVEGKFMAEGPRFLSRSRLYEWKTVANCDIFWSDSGELVHVPDLTSFTKNYSSPGDANAVKLLSMTAERLGEQIKAGLLHAMARRALDGGVIRIKIDNVSPERQFMLEDYFNALETVENADPVSRYETAVIFDVHTKLLRKTLERHLMLAKFELDGREFKLGFPQSVGRTIVFKAKDVD